MKFINVRLLALLSMIFSLSCNSDETRATGSATGPVYQTKEVTAAYVAAMAALVVGGLSFWQFLVTRKDQKKNLTISREDQKDSEINRNLWEALKWFEHGTQKRSIGIAVVEAYWEDEKRKDIKKAWIPLLINQVIHILEASDEKDKATEHVNLERIISLLKSAILDKAQKKSIRNTLAQANLFNQPVPNGKKGIFITEQQRDKWSKYFPE
jgi:hypothetical protein